MKRKIILIHSLCLMTLLFSCNKDLPIEKNKYVVIWQNYNGEILETDRDVEEGSIPTYDGPTPTRSRDEQYKYTFSHWSPTVEKIYENMTYTARFKEESTNQNPPLGGDDTPIEWPDVNFPGLEPVLSKDKNYVQYGFYPTTHVKEESLVEQLNALTSKDENGWYTLDNKYYVKEKASIYNNEKYTFGDGEAIVNEKEYWLCCEPITWKILNENNGTYLLLSTLLLDAHNFYDNYEERNIDNKTIYPNNYEHSSIRSWLNNEFYNKAFHYNNSYLEEVTVDNSTKTLDGNKKNPYVSNNTKDKVYLLSYQDYINEDYGFDPNANNASKSRSARTTDYARIKGSWCNLTDYNGTYWTRSPSSEFSYASWNINSGGYLSNYAVDGNSHSIRPSISLKIS